MSVQGAQTQVLEMFRTLLSAGDAGEDQGRHEIRRPPHALAPPDSDRTSLPDEKTRMIAEREE
jgi:hypothetical protein